MAFNSSGDATAGSAGIWCPPISSAVADSVRPACFLVKVTAWSRARWLLCFTYNAKRVFGTHCILAVGTGGLTLDKIARRSETTKAMRSGIDSGSAGARDAAAAVSDTGKEFRIADG